MNGIQQTKYTLNSLISLPILPGVCQDYARMAHLAELTELVRLRQQLLANLAVKKMAPVEPQQLLPEFQASHLQMSIETASMSKEHRSIVLRQSEPFVQTEEKKVQSGNSISDLGEDLANDDASSNEQPVNLQSEECSMPAKEQNEGFMEFSDVVQIRQYEAHYGRVILEKFKGQDKAFVTFYPNFTAQDEIREAELEEMTAIFSKNGKIDRRETIKSSFVKNFSKMNGDQFANFASTKYKIESFKKIFKDKSSCMRLSEYLDGTKKVERMNVKAFIRMYFDFIQEVNVENIDKSKVGSKNLRTCYKLIYSYMKSVLEALREWDLLEKIYSVQIEKFWPNVELSMKWEIEQN